MGGNLVNNQGGAVIDVNNASMGQSIPQDEATRQNM
jgi:hypothetical protein